MTMSLTILDLALIGATAGLSTLASMIITMRYMRSLDRKRKMIVIEEMMSQMHDKMQTEHEFSEIVKRMRAQQGEETND